MTRNSLIYIASPYDDSAGVDIQDIRYKIVAKLCVKMISAGMVVHSPVVYSHQLARMGAYPPQGWYSYDVTMLERSDILLVYMIDNWDYSKGIRYEIDYAESHDIPVFYLDDSDVETLVQDYRTYIQTCDVSCNEHN